MPISIEQFDHLGDYSGLDDLHVYGNLLSLYSLRVDGQVGEINRLYDRIRSLDDRIFTLYVAYVLSRAGFSAMHVVELDKDLQMKSLDTTKFEDHHWLEHLDSFEIVDEGYRDEWVRYFENERNETIKVMFVTLLHSEMDPTTKECDEATHLLQELQPGECGLNYVVVHPRLSRKAKETFIKTKRRMKQIIGKDIVLSTGEFASKFVPDENKRKMIETNWEVLREKLLNAFKKEWPIIVYSTNEQQLFEIRERLRKVRWKFEMRHDLEEAVRDAGLVCEGLLQILHSMYPKDVKERMDFNELLCDLKETIVKDFGEDIYCDLDLIREWRNKVSHPPITVPNSRIALKIVTKAKLFHELFHEKLKEQLHSRK
jgi:hypothetical protein